MAQVAIGMSPPPSPQEGDVWTNSATRRRYQWVLGPNGGAWVQFSSEILPTSPPAARVSPPTVMPTAAPIVAVTPKHTMSPTPPTSPAPVPGDFWTSTVTGFLFSYYNDGNTIQWVVANPGKGEGTTWNSLPGKPTSFPPSAHTHVQDDITDLPKITVGPTAPSSPAVNDLWVDTT